MPDDAPPPPRSRAEAWSPSRWSQAAHLLLLLGAASAISVAGRAHQGQWGVFLIFAGLALVICPPQFGLSWKAFALSGVLGLCGAAALLPQAWFPEPAWRQMLAATAFPAVASVSPAPGETLFWLAMFGIGIFVALFAQAHPLDSRGLLVVAVAAVLIGGGYIGVATFAHQTGWEYPFTFNPEIFGFFPNRNHTATFLVITCVLALGILGVAFRWRVFAAVVAVAALGLGVTGLISFSASRGGVVFLVAGTLLWIAGLGRAHRSKPLLISFAAIFVGGALLFLASKGKARERVLELVKLDQQAPGANPVERPLEAADWLMDSRVLIFRDTLAMIREFPLSGSGLGTFRYVFPFYRKHSLGDLPIWHPESDWLMFVAEAGVPALLLVVAGLGWLLRRVWSLRHRPSWPLRWGLLSAAFAAGMHGIVDVPAHRTALGWWILVILGVGLQKAPRVPVPAPRIQHALFILAGLGAIALGVPLVRAQWFDGPSLPPYAGFAAQTEIMGLRVEGKIDEAVKAARRAIRQSPMTDGLYYQLGATLLEAKAPFAETDAALLTQRLLSPTSPAVCVEQGLLWMEADPARTASLWLEALRRREAIDAVRGGDARVTLAFYRDLISQAAPAPEVQRRLLTFEARDPAFALVWMSAAESAIVAPELTRLASDAAFLAVLDEPARRRFLRVWYDRGPRPELFAFIDSRPEWAAASWPIKIRRLVEAGDFQTAVNEVARHHQMRLDLPPVTADEQTLEAADESNAPAAFEAYWRRGNVRAARRVLDEAREKSADPEVWRLNAALAAQEGRWPAAWQAIERWLSHSGLDSFR